MPKKRETYLCPIPISPLYDKELVQYMASIKLINIQKYSNRKIHLHLNEQQPLENFNLTELNSPFNMMISLI